MRSNEFEPERDKVKIGPLNVDISFGQTRSEQRHLQRKAGSTEEILWNGHQGEQSQPDEITEGARHRSLPESIELNRTEALFLDAAGETLDEVDELYAVYKDAGMWPADITDEQRRRARMDKFLGDPHRPVIRGPSEGGLISVNPREYPTPETGARFDRIAMGIGKMEILAGHRDINDPQLQAHLGATRETFETGTDFERSARLLPLVDSTGVFAYVNIADEDESGKYWPQGWAGKVNPSYKEALQPEVDMLLDWWEASYHQRPPHIGVLPIEETTVAGQARYKRWSANSMPNEPRIRREEGSIFFILLQQYREKFAEKWAEFNEIIAPQVLEGLTSVDLMEADLLQYIGHETGHGLGIPDNYLERLGDYALPTKEHRCDLLALEAAFALNPTDQRAQKTALAAYIIEGWMRAKPRLMRNRVSRSIEDTSEYYAGPSIEFDRLLREGAVVIEDHRIVDIQPHLARPVIAEDFQQINKILLSEPEEKARSYFANKFRVSFKNLTDQTRGTPEFILQARGKAPSGPRQRAKSALSNVKGIMGGD